MSLEKFMIALVCTATMMSLEAKELSDEQIAHVVKIVATKLKCKESDIKVESDKRKTVFDFRVRKFLIHSYTPARGYSDKPKEMEGPAHKGIRIQVGIFQGKYNGKFILPQTIKEPYWSVYLTQKDLGQSYIHIVLRFGKRVLRANARDLAEEILKAL